MAEIQDPQVIRFTNEVVRHCADMGYSFWRLAQDGLQRYNSENIGSLINDAGAGNLIADNSDVDGRTRLTGGDVYNFITLLGAFIAFVENGAVSTADRKDVLTKPYVNRIG